MTTNDNNKNNSKLKGDAPAFVPRQDEPFQLQAPYNAASEPLPYCINQQQQYQQAGGFYPIGEMYPSPDWCYVSPTAPWFSADTGYIYPMDPFAEQLQQVDQVRLEGNTQYYNYHHGVAPFTPHAPALGPKAKSRNKYKKKSSRKERKLKREQKIAEEKTFETEIVEGEEGKNKDWN